MAFHYVYYNTAFAMLRQTSQDMNIKITEVAREIIDHQNTRRPEPGIAPLLTDAEPTRSSSTISTTSVCVRRSRSRAHSPPSTEAEFPLACPNARGGTHPAIDGRDELGSTGGYV